MSTQSPRTPEREEAQQDEKSQRSGLRLRKTDLALLAEISEQNVTWREVGGLRSPTRRVYRLWTSETEWRLATPRVARLIKAGFARTFMAAGYTHIGRGGVELTTEGRKALTAAKASP